MFEGTKDSGVLVAKKKNRGWVQCLCAGLFFTKRQKFGIMAAIHYYIRQREKEDSVRKIIEEKLLLKVQKPGRYIGGEYNSVQKELREDMLHFAFAFPDIYEVGMSHVGLKILYHLLNEQENIWCERVFAPWVDADAVMKQEQIPLFSLESYTPVKAFDVVGFTLQYEMCYTNVLNMLTLAGIALRSEDRTESDPVIMAGGPCALNPEPMADFMDLFVVGEGEEVILELAVLLLRYKKGELSKREMLFQASQLQGVYVPGFYEVSYHADGTIAEFAPTSAGVPERIKKRIIRDMDKVYYPTKPMVPYIQIVHDRITQEIFRGCIRGCRFCQAGFVYRPGRDKSKETVIKQIEQSLAATGYDEVSLVSLSSMDYLACEEVVNYVMEQHAKDKISVALPSLRMDGFSIDIARKIQQVRKTGLTFAPEAGSERMRRVINKGITEEDIKKTALEVFGSGWGRIKLYFMMGLPYEEEKDVLEILTVAQKVLDCYYAVAKEKRNKNVTVAVSVACFVPKPHTPFQWQAQNMIEEFQKKQRLLKLQKTNRKITLSTHEPYLSALEGVFALGDRRLGKVLEEAVKNGCIFDGWDEVFAYEKWVDAFQKAKIDPAFYANRQKGYEEKLPWDFIDVGVEKAFLIQENEKAKQAQTTPNCRLQCSACGIGTDADYGGFCQ